MAETSDGYQQFVLDDFRPGIYSDYHGAGGQATDTTLGYKSLPTDPQSKPVLGLASITNTYRCCADPHSGALMPLPKLTLVQSQTLLPNGNTNIGTTWYPTNRAAAYLTDAVVRVGVADSTGAAVTSDPTETVALYQFYWDPSNTSTYKWFTQGVCWQSFRTGVPVRHFVWSKVVTVASPYPIYPGGMDIVQSIEGIALGNPAWNSFRPRVVGAIIGPNLMTVGAIPANENSVMTYDTDMAQGANYTVGIDLGAGSIISSIFVWPRVGPTRTVGDYDITEQVSLQLLGAFYVTAHQGRAMFPTYIGAQSDATQSYQLKDVVLYTPVLDLQANDTATTWSARTPSGITIGDENVSQIGCIASISADEMLIIKQKEGGYVVRGDIDNPTVQRLPFLESCGGLVSRGISTPVGHVYGSKSGIYAYTGGETSRSLSPQIEGMFWAYHTSTENFNGVHGKFGYMYPWVAIPNQFFYDIRTESWWRIELPSTASGPLPFSVYQPIGITTSVGLAGVPAINKLRCFPYKLTATRNEAYYEIDPLVLASSYSWQSHPIFADPDRFLTLQTVELVASIPGGTVATQTVVVTITGFDREGTQVASVATTFTLGTSTTNPQTYRQDIIPNIEGMVTHFKVRIESADSSTNVAPKVHSVKVGTRTGAQIQKAVT